MSDEARRRQQSTEARRRAEQKIAYYGTAEWRQQQAKNMAEATQRLADTPERREQAKREHLEQVRRQERWDAEDREDDADAEAYRQTLREKRRKERGR